MEKYIDFLLKDQRPCKSQNLHFEAAERNKSTSEIYQLKYPVDVARLYRVTVMATGKPYFFTEKELDEINTTHSV